MATKRRTGRPSKCTEVLACRLVEHVSHGASPNQAARLVNVGDSTFLVWRQKADAEPESIYGRLFEAIEQAQLSIYARATKNLVDDLSSDDPRLRQKASQFWVERRHSDEWGRRTEQRLTGADGGAIRAEHTGPNGQPIALAVRVLPAFTDEQLRDMAPEVLGAAVRAIVRAGLVRGHGSLLSPAQLSLLSVAQHHALASVLAEAADA